MDSAPAADVPPAGHSLAIPSSQYDPAGHSSGSPSSDPPGQFTPSIHFSHVAVAVPWFLAIYPALHVTVNVHVGYALPVQFTLSLSAFAVPPVIAPPEHVI